MAPTADTSGKLRVKKDLLAKAIRALHKLIQKRSASTNQLFASNSETMTLLFTLGKIPDKKRMKAVMIPLPHPLYDEKSEVCFIAKDPQKTYKELLLNKHPVPGLTKVIGVDKLRRNYKTPELKRALADAYDLFLCDSRVVECMPKLLGSVFYNKKHKAPVPVKLLVTDPKPNIELAIKGTPLRIPTGPCIGVRFGRCSMSEDELLKNATAVIRGIVDNVKGNLVMNIAVQATDAPALPVWRRPAAPGGLVDLKKYHSDASSSSAASETGASGASATDGGSEIEYGDLPSDAGETLSARDTASDIESTGGDLSLDSHSELDSDAGDGGDIDLAPEKMPLVKGLNDKKNKRRQGASPKTSPKTSPRGAPGKKAPAPPGEVMPPPAKKAKKGAAKAKGKA